MAFDYPVTLDLEGRPCLLGGGGPLAIERLTGLLRSRADVIVVTPDPSPGLSAQCGAFGVPLLERLLQPDDLDGAMLAIVTREDGADVPALYIAAREHGVLFAALDDVEHCDFGAMSQIRRGSLTVTISSGGRAPALSKRLRKHLERTLTHELAELVEVIDEAKAAHGPRTVPFDQWAGQWEDALTDLQGLLAQLRDGEREEVRNHILATIAAQG